jgi:hypothetical protein
MKPTIKLIGRLTETLLCHNIMFNLWVHAKMNEIRG